MPLDPCIEQQVGRRRVFWTTQPLVCGEYFLCGHECVIPGLEYIDTYVRSSSSVFNVSVIEGAAALDVVSATASESAAIAEPAAAADVVSAGASSDVAVTESAAASDMQDAAGSVIADTHMRILSASRAGIGSAAVVSGAPKTQIVSNIGAVT